MNGVVEAAYAVTIATERDQALETVTLAWLTRWQIRRTAIAVTGTGGKDRLLAGHGHDRPAILIDDDPAKERLVRPGVQVWVPPRTWAPDGLAPENVWRIETWRHIAARLESDARTPR